MRKLIPAIFLDRDRVINDHDDDEYILHWDQFRFIPGVMEAMFRLHGSPYQVFVISNQSGIGRQMEYAGKVVTQADVYNIFRRMEEVIASEINDRLLCNAGVPGEPQLALVSSMVHDREKMDVPMVIRDFLFCPHDPKDGCCCRKPKPGMIYVLAHMYGIDLNKSWMIGDKDSDIKAGWNAGIRRLIQIDGSSVPGEPGMSLVEQYVPGSMNWSKFSLTLSARPVVPSLLNAVQFIEDRDKWETEHVR